MKPLNDYVAAHERFASTLQDVRSHCRESMEQFQQLSVHASNHLDEEFCQRSSYRLHLLEDAVTSSLRDVQHQIARLKKMEASGEFAVSSTGRSNGRALHLAHDLST